MNRIGEGAMVFLLTNYSIFLNIQNGCYIQLTGLAINKLPLASKFYTSEQIIHKIQKVMHFDRTIEKEEIALDHVKVIESIVLDENLKTQKKRPITDIQETSSKAIILNNRDVIKMCKDFKNINVNNELAALNENNYLEIQKKHLNEENNWDITKVPNTNSISNLRFSRSVMFFGSPVYNKYDEPWYGLPKERKY